MSGPFTYPVAASVPFDGTETVEGVPTDPPFVSENVRDGIIEARDFAEGTAAGYVIGCGKSANVSNAYLEFFDSLPSDQNPFIFVVNNILTGFSASTKTNSTCDYEVRINGVTIYTLQQINSTSAFIGGLEIPVLAGDKLSIYVSNGAASRPLFNTFSKIG